MKQVVVIGAGIVGLCAADSLMRRGFDVLVLEKDSSPGEGCSFGNGGLVTPSHFEPLAAPGMVGLGIRMLPDKESPFGFSRVPGPQMAGWMMRFALAANSRRARRAAPVLRDLHLASRKIFEERFDSAEVGYARTGAIMLCRTESRLKAEMQLAEEAKHLGLSTRNLSRSELKQLEPDVEFDVAGGVLFEDDAHLTPPALMESLRKDLIERGCEIRQREELLSLTHSKSAITGITTSRGTFAVEEIVVAAGAWSGWIAEELGFNLPMAAGKGYGFTVSDAPVKPKIATILIEGRVAVTPMKDGLRFVGTMELGQTSAPTINPNRLTGMRKSIEAFYPAFRGFDWNSVPVWAGLRPCTPDGMPYVGRLGVFSNVTIAAGHAMIGLSLGPITGELVAQIIAGEEPSIPLDLLSPNRYA